MDAHITAMGAGGRTSRAAAAAAEERVEDVAEAEARAAEDVGYVDVVGTEAAGAVGVAIAIVVGALLVVGEHRVRLVDLLELLLSVRVVRDVGVELTRKLKERALDRLCVGVLCHAEHLVEVLLRFQDHQSPNKRKFTCR